MKYIRKEFDIDKSAYVDAYILDGEISYRVTRKRPALIICPGGGYLMTATKEKEAIAMEFLSKGYHCFVLKYSTYFNNRMTSLNHIPEVNPNGYFPNQLLELMTTMHWIHENAQEWNIDAENIFVSGFSAGGHLAAFLSNHWNDKAYTNLLAFKPFENELKPKGVVLGYPLLCTDLCEHMMKQCEDAELIKHQTEFIFDCLVQTKQPTKEQLSKVDNLSAIHEKTSPTFIWTTRNDQIVDPKNALKYIHRLMELDIDCELHMYSHGPHGLGMATKEYAKNEKEIDENIQSWVKLSQDWMERQIQKG